MSEDRTVMIEVSWDSGPYGSYGREPDDAPAMEQDHYGRYVVPIPASIWERYERARDEFSAAEDALEEAAEKAHEALFDGGAA